MRTALTILSIVIAVGAVVSMSIGTATTRAAHLAMFAAVSGRADLEVVAEGGGAFPISVAVELEAIEGVRAVPSLRRYTIVYLPNKTKARAQVLGIVPDRDQLVRDYEVVDGRVVASGPEVMVDATFARGLGVTVGDQIRLLTSIGLKESEVVGILEPRGGSAIATGGLVYMSLGLAQSRFRARGRVDTVQLVLDESVDVDKIQAVVADRLPVGLTVRQPTMQSQLAQQTMLATDQGLQLATAFALVIAAFVIFNTFQMTVGERRRQLGILRAIGATRRQVRCTILREGLLMGLVGTVIGSLVGIGGALLLTGATETLLQTPMPALQIGPVSFLLAVAFGLGVSLIAVFVPARRAGNLEPSEAMMAVLSADTESPRGWFNAVGVVTLLASAALLGGCILGWLPIEIAVSSAIAMLIGIVVLLPTILGAATKLVQRALTPWLGIECRLAQRRLLRNRGRTALTIGVLFIAASTGVGLASTIIDNVRDVRQWYRQAIVGDFFVRAMMPDMASGQAADMPEELHDAINSVPGVTELDTIRFVSASSGDNSVIVVIREFLSQEQIYFDLVEGDAQEVVESIARGDVVIGTVLAQRMSCKLGDSIPLETRDGPRQLRVVGIANDYIAGGLTIYMHREVAKDLLGVEGVDAYIVQADDRRLASVEAALKGICDEYGLLLQSYTELVGFIEGTMNGVIASLWALLALGFLIAAFGLFNTLTMNILEQTREIGVLRVVAMTRRQVRRTILAQVLIMGLIALAPGVMFGMGIAYLINLATLPVTGHAIAFVFRPWLPAACFAAALTIVLVAAWFPAEKAARLKLTDALHYE